MIDAQYLKEMRNMTRNVKGEAVKLRQMKEELFCIGSVGFGQHIQRTKSSDPMGNRIAAYVDFENEYHKYVIEYIEKYKTMNEAIRDLDIMNQMFIINYCFFGMDYSEIAENMGVSEQTVYRIRIDTLKELERIDSNE